MQQVHTDHLDTPRSLNSGTGGAAWRAAYRAFGSTTPDEDPDQDLSAVRFAIRFPGQFEDPESSLYDNRFRVYSPTVGRYLEADPLRQVAGANVYLYARLSPASWSDPTGLSAIAGLEDLGGGGPPWQDPQVSQGLCARLAFLSNYTAMRRANWQNSDQYFHCKANCEAAKCGPYGCEEAAALSDAREWFDQHIKGDSPAESALDQGANRHGRTGAVTNPMQACQVTCAPFRPPGLPAPY